MMAEGKKKHPGRTGRPRKYPEEISKRHGGAPQLKVRVAPELYDWIKSKGGSAWVRERLEEMMAADQPPADR